MKSFGLHKWDDFVAHAAKRLTKEACRGGGSSSKSSGDDSWSGASSLEAALKMATGGWQKGADAVGRTLDNVTPSADVLPDWKLDVAGFLPCMPAVMAGEPECFWMPQDEQKQVRRIALIVNGVFHAGVTADAAMNYAKAVAATVRAIEATGMDVAVYSVDRRRGNDETIYGTIVRSFGEPLDLAKVAFAFHPAWLRRIGFAWCEMTQAACDAGIASGGYGAVRELALEEARDLIGDLECAAVTLSSVSSMYNQRKLNNGDTGVREVIELFRTEVDAAIKALGGEQS